jgi:hypothetical protein
MNQVIVLDVDETLLHTFEGLKGWYKLKILQDARTYPIRSRLYNMKLTDVDEPIGSGDMYEIWGIERPYLKEFIDYCLQRFDHVIIWSAGRRRYVDRLTDRIFRCTKSDPKLILNWDNINKYKNGDYDKPITALKEHFPDLADDINLENTFIVDDRRDNFLRTNIDNGILIPPYNPAMTIDGLLSKDDKLQVLMKWFELDEVKYAQDVRTLDKAIW